MVYTLCYFKYAAVEVGKTNWINEEDQKVLSSKTPTRCPKLEEDAGWKCHVARRKKEKGGLVCFPAKVLMFGGK